MLRWITDKLPGLMGRSATLATPRTPMLLHAGPDVLSVSWPPVPDAVSYTVAPSKVKPCFVGINF